MTSKITVAQVSADMFLNMDKNSINKVQTGIKNTAKHLKHDLGEIGEGAKESLKELTASAGGLGSVVGGALSGLAKAGPMGLIAGGLAAALGSAALQAEHMSKQFESSVQTITELKAKAEGLGLTVQKYQRLQYLAGISGVNTSDLERVMGRINITAGEIQTNGAGSTEETRVLSEMLGGDGRGLTSDQKLHAVLDSLRQEVAKGNKDGALYALKVLAPRAALDPAMQSFFLNSGLKNWDKGKNYKEVLSKKDEAKLEDPRNLEAYYGNQVGNVTKELHRVAIHIENLRKNYKNVDDIEEGLKDKLAVTAPLVTIATSSVVLGGEAAGSFFELLGKSDFWSNIGKGVANGLKDSSLYSNIGKSAYNWFTADHNYLTNLSK